jgi:phage gp46-like protein
LRRKYKTVYDDLANILFRHDPVHIASRRDEYEPEVGRILAGTKDVRSVDDLTDAIHSVFIEMFDRSTAGDRAKYEPIARELWVLIRPTR